MPAILVAEDDKNIQLLISERLNLHYTVILVNNGEEALELLAETHVDLLIADIKMPRMDGFELIQRVRETNSDMPILILTANHTFDAKRIGFSAGIDDYLTKPFAYEELLWRVQALLRRARIVNDKKIVSGDLTLDLLTYTVLKGELEIHLPKKEFELLYKLMSYPDRIFTKNQLLDEIWGFQSESGEETVKTHISRLRNKIKVFPEIAIIAVKGIGYKIEVSEK